MAIQMIAVTTLATAATGAAAQQSFSCGFGKEPACLDYGAKVVKRGAQCFDEYQCFPSGFVCKSEMDELRDDAVKIAESYDSLRTCLSGASEMEDVSRCMRDDSFRN